MFGGKFRTKSDLSFGHLSDRWVLFQVDCQKKGPFENDISVNSFWCCFVVVVVVVVVFVFVVVIVINKTFW
jgi:hypothetical protein